MKKLPEKAIGFIAALPPETQDEITREILAFATEGDEFGPLSDDDLAAIARGLADIATGRIATEAEVAAVFGKALGLHSDQQGAPLSPELLAALDRSSAQIDRGEVATDAEIEEIFRRFEA